MASTPTLEQLQALPPEYMNEINDPSRLVATGVAFAVINTVVFVLFSISRYFHAERNGWEVWAFYPLSYILSMALCALSILFVQIGGSGRHLAYWLLNDPAVIVTYLKIQTSVEFIYMAGVSLPKVCILILYLRIFVDRKVRVATWVVLGIVVANYVATGIIADFTICQPFAFKWDKTIPDGKCANLMAAYRYISIPNILTDLAILALPLTTLYGLQTSRLRKLGLVVTFLTGGLGIVTSVVRFVGFYTTDLESDPTYLSIDTQIWTLVEPCAYFICSCLPGTRPLLGKIYKKSRLATTTRNITQYHDGSWGGGGSGKNTGRTKNSGGMETVVSIRPNGSNVGSVTTVTSTTELTNIYHERSNAGQGFIRLNETVDVDYEFGHGHK